MSAEKQAVAPLPELKISEDPVAAARYLLDIGTAALAARENQLGILKQVRAAIKSFLKAHGDGEGFSITQFGIYQNLQRKLGEVTSAIARIYELRARKRFESEVWEHESVTDGTLIDPPWSHERVPSLQIVALITGRMRSHLQRLEKDPVEKETQAILLIGEHPEAARGQKLYREETSHSNDSLNSSGRLSAYAQLLIPTFRSLMRDRLFEFLADPSHLQGLAIPEIRQRLSSAPEKSRLQLQVLPGADSRKHRTFAFFITQVPGLSLPIQTRDGTLEIKIGIGIEGVQTVLRENLDILFAKLDRMLNKW